MERVRSFQPMKKSWIQMIVSLIGIMQLLLCGSTVRKTPDCWQLVDLLLAVGWIPAYLHYFQNKTCPSADM